MVSWRGGSLGDPTASLRRYKKILGRAKKFELDRHSVILCTCSCAASASLKNLDVRQILVDEAGMATEPETLIPLVNFSHTEKVRQAVMPDRHRWDLTPGMQGAHGGQVEVG